MAARAASAGRRALRWRAVALLAAWAFAATAAAAEVELRVAQRSEQIEERAELGAVTIEGVGAVSVFAQRRGAQIVLRAGGPDGTALGKAEAPIGLARMPVYVQTPKGLEKIVVVWGVEKPEP